MICIGWVFESNLRLANPHVSQHHTKLTYTPNSQPHIIDTNTNNIYINNKHIINQTLTNNDIIRLDDTIFITRDRDPNQPIELPLPGCIGDSATTYAMYRTVRT